MLTARDTGAPTRRRNIASLVGGFVIAIGVFVLWVLVGAALTGSASNAVLVISGAIVASIVGIWIRIADL